MSKINTTYFTKGCSDCSAMSRYDLVLVHAPSVYDFRKRSLFYGPVSDLVPSTPIFEMYPIGFITIASILAKNGYKVRILNLATKMLADKKFDADKLINRIDSKVFGIDLHWLPHAHGSIEIAQMIKHHHVDSKVVLGGFSSTYYFQEILKDYLDIDAVFLGDSTEIPMLEYMRAIESNRSLESVPNIAYRNEGAVKSNGITHIVENMDDVDFDYGFFVRSAMKTLDLTGHMPYLDWKRNPMLLVSTVRGCYHSCVTCMGACGSFKRNFGRKKPAFRSPEKVLEDIRQIECYFNGAIFLLGDIQQSGPGYAEKLLSLLKKERPKNEIAFEFFTPPNAEIIKRIGESVDNFDAQISPDSHDPVVREAQGRHYSNQDLEKAIGEFLSAGARRVDIFFMLGLPKQTPESVKNTVDYSEKLMIQFKAGERFLPFISPLAPFIDPGSDAFESPAQFGYKIFARTLDEHRWLLLKPSWKYVLNYETNWMTRDQIVSSTYSAGYLMNDSKQKAGAITPEAAAAVRKRISAATQMMTMIDSIVRSSKSDESIDGIRENLLAISESTVCDKRELDWSRKSYYWSIPKAIISAMLGR